MWGRKSPLGPVLQSPLLWMVLGAVAGAMLASSGSRGSQGERRTARLRVARRC